jgi:hypothetical protein
MATFSTGSPGGGVGASFFIRPGRKKVAGETEPPALIPPHPVKEKAQVVRIASCSNFQFNLTHSNYKTIGYNGNL